VFLVTGATGTVGGALTRLLAARGAPVRAMSRHPERASFPAGAEPWAADFSDPASVKAALAGTRRVFLLTGRTARATTRSRHKPPPRPAWSTW
jgi:uncharacterized protein YbjT (DUF2867 family)